MSYFSKFFVTFLFQLIWFFQIIQENKLSKDYSSLIFKNLLQDLNENDELVFNSEVPSESNYMVICQTQSDTFYNNFTYPLFANEVYFQMLVSLLVDENGNKFFQFGIRAIPLKGTLIDLELNLHVSTRGPSIGQEIVRMKNHDGIEYEIRNCDFPCDFPCKQFKIVLGNIQINEYDEKNYETMNFKITLPTEKTHEKSGIVPGDFKWYRNISPRKIKFKGGDLMFQLKHSLIRSKNFR